MHDAHDLDAGQQRFLDRLRTAVAAADPVPPLVMEAARAAFGWRTMEAELAQLTYDSAQDLALAGVRGGGEVRLLTFACDELTVDLQVVADGDERTLVGALDPQQAALVHVVHDGGVASVRTDERGRFRLTGIAAGAARLRCRLLGPGGALVSTDPLPL